MAGITTIGVRERATVPVVVVAAAGVAFLAGRGDLGRPAEILAALLAVFVAVAATRAPLPAACIGLGLVVAVPIYWAQPLPVLPLASTAGAVTGVLLFPAATTAWARLHLTLLDGLVVLYFLISIASIGANVEGQTAAIADLLARSVLPYVVFRLLATLDGAPTRLAATLVGVAVPLAVIGIQEGNGNGNPFFTLVRPGFEAGQWVRSQVRFGEVRAESSFGHAIAFGLFLAIALVLLLGLAWKANGRGRFVLLLASGVLVAALLATVSRGGVLSVGVGALLWGVALRGRRTGLLVVAAVVAAGLLLTPAGDELARLRDSVSDAGEAGDAARYRLEIARIATDSDTFSILGQEAPPGLGVVAGAKELLGLRTIDSQYALVYVTNGAVGLASFVAIALAAIAIALRRRLDPVERAWAAATAATAIALTSVALFTQMLTLFWIAVAVTAAVASRVDD